MRFRTRLFLIMAALTASIMLVTIAVVNGRFRANVDKAVGSEFEYAHLRLDRFQRLGLENLVTLAVNISQDPRLRGSIATRDPGTIQQSVNEIFPNYSTDLFWLLSPDGKVITSVDDSTLATSAPVVHPVIEDAINGFDSGDLWLHKGKLYQVAVVPVKSANITVGLLLIGEEFDGHLTKSFKELTGLQVGFLGDGKVLSFSGSPEFRESFSSIVGTLLSSREFTAQPLPNIPIMPQQPDSLRAPFVRFEVWEEPFAGALFRLSDVTHRTLARGIIFRSLSIETVRLRQIQESLLIVGFLSLLVTFLAAYFISQRVTRPLRRLAESSERLGKGDLESAIHPEGRGEIGALAVELEEMRISLKRARDDLIQSERLSTIGRLASSIVHDFRQPITVIYGYLELLTMPNAKPESVGSYREAIFKQFDRMLGMINELLDFARGEIKLKLRPVQLSSIVAEVMSSFEREIRTRSVVIEPGLEWDGLLTIDLERLQRGLENIIKNAVQILPLNGRIEIRSHLEENMVVISIADNGPGIPPEIIKTIFEPFVTHGKSGGTGLGLAVAKRVVQQHGGDILVESEVGNGATFHIRIPITKEEPSNV